MALSQDDRLGISKKLIDIPVENALADQISDQLDVAKAEAEKKDNANIELVNRELSLINGYQQELGRYTGYGYTELVEQDFQDSADKLLNNPFFPNDPNTPLPSVPDGVWKFFPPISTTKATGRDNFEAYPSITKEQDLIDAINTQIAVMEGYAAIERSTGEECITGAPDVIQPYVALQATGSALIAAVQAWEDFLNGTSAVIVTTDTDPTRSAENIASQADITNAISVIDTWQALANYDNAHGQTTCVGFYAYDPNTLNPTKFRATELNVLKAEITARQSFITTRTSQMQGHFGTITTNPSNGQIVTATGFYGRRFRFIDLRLNLMSGSLSQVKSAERGQQAQDELKASNDNAEAAYSSVMAVTLFRAPAAGTGTIHVKDASSFSISDSVYVAANEQAELSATILNIQGDIVYLDISIPKNYRQDEGARLYKVL